MGSLDAILHALIGQSKLAVMKRTNALRLARLSIFPPTGLTTTSIVLFFVYLDMPHEQGASVT